MATTSNKPLLRLIDWSELRRRIPLSRSTVWRLIRKGRFPAPLKISPGRVAWREDDIQAWMDGADGRALISQR